MRALIGTISAVLAITLSVYLMLMIFNIVPIMDIYIFNVSFIKFIAQLTVFLYLLAAWAFWSV